MSPRSGEPIPVGRVLDQLIARGGWQDRLNVSRLREAWSSVVGPQIAAHCVPVRLSGGVLSIKAEAGVWTTELTMLSRRLLTQADEWLGGGIVTEIKVWADR